jgi:hypothetical protein
MEFKLENGILEFDREITDLDSLVFDFVSLLDESNIKYVIISGYVAIAMGRARTTEDIDIFIEKMKIEKFRRFALKLEKKGYWILNTDSIDDAFDMLDKELAIRFAEKDKAIPNFEIKFPKKETDMLSIGKPLTVIISGHRMLMSPLEIQIPFKLWLGTDKDIEDAVHLYELFKDKLNKSFMDNISNSLGVQKEMVKYGIK